MSSRRRKTSRRSRGLSGKKTWFICERSGQRVLFRDTVVEPGTGLRVAKRWSDGRWNRVDHPQNFSADASDAINIKDPRPDRKEPIGVAFLTDDDVLLLGSKGLPIIIT